MFWSSAPNVYFNYINTKRRSLIVNNFCVDKEALLLLKKKMLNVHVETVECYDFNTKALTNLHMVLY